MIQGVANQGVGAQMVNATTGGAYVGTVTVYVTLNPPVGVQVIGSVGGGICQSEGNGYYSYAPSVQETNAAFIAFTFVGTGAIPATIQVATISPSQQAALSIAGQPAAVACSAIITAALFEIRVARAGDVPAPEIMDYGLQLLNELFDGLNASPDRQAIYAEQFLNFTLTPNLNPHTIGPTGTFVQASRPASLEFASINLGGGPPPIYRPLNIRGKAWYANQHVPDLAALFPSDVYYEPSFPNGSLYQWPIATMAYQIRLWMRTLLQGVTLTSTFALPVGWQSAIRLTLAEMLAPGLGQTVSASTAQRARTARSNIFANNTEPPRLHTADSGLGGSTMRSRFNWLDRSTR